MSASGMTSTWRNVTNHVLSDTGPLYALADPSDQYHRRAVRELQSLAKEGQAVAIAYPTLAECYTLVLRRLGRSYCRSWLTCVLFRDTATSAFTWHRPWCDIIAIYPGCAANTGNSGMSSDKERSRPPALAPMGIRKLGGQWALRDLQGTTAMAGPRKPEDLPTPSKRKQ